MLWRITLPLTCLFLHVACQTDNTKAQPPMINSGFPKVIYFRSSDDKQQLDCIANGIPSPQYEWFKDGLKIVTDTNNNIKVTGGTLELTAPTYLNIGIYQCFAFNSHGKSMSSMVDISKAETEAYPSLSIITQEASVGDHAVLGCRGQPKSTPAALVDWFLSKNDAIVTSARIVLDQSGSLHFINAEKSDQLATDKTYNCSVYNPVVLARFFGSPTKLIVNEVSGPIPPRAPAISYYTPDVEAVALLGSMVTLQCIPDGYPIPTIEWTKEGDDLPFGRHEIFPNTYKLTIRNVTELDEGRYTCTAVHGNERVEKTIFVNVKSEPIWVNKLRSLTVTDGKTAQFECVARSAIGETDNVIVQWFQNGDPLPSGITSKITVSGTRLTVTDVLKPYDLSNYQCKVSNTIGYQMADAYLNVISRTVLTVKPEDKVAIDPGKVAEVTIAAVADPLYASRLTYTWTINGIQIGKDPGHYVYVNQAHTLVINATKLERDPSFLQVLGNYSCHVTMGLPGGEGDVITYTMVSSKDEAGIIGNAELDLWWIAIIVAVIVLIVILVLICCLLYRNRGGTYPVDEKERRAGHDPEKELADRGFQDLSRADAPDEKKPYGNPDQVSLTNDPPLGGDTDSLDEYGEPDTSKFNEDGSFIGNYGRKGRDANQSTA